MRLNVQDCVRVVKVALKDSGKKHCTPESVVGVIAYMRSILELARGMRA